LCGISLGQFIIESSLIGVRSAIGGPLRDSTPVFV
jgi:hypothetical protein